MELFDEILNIYTRKLKIPKSVVYLLSDYDIIYNCVSGLSNKSISEYLDIDEEDIKETLIKRLNFSGWYEDLEINPIYIYEKTNGIKDLYVKVIMSIPSNLYKPYINKSFRICKRFSEYERRINKYYA